MNEPMLGKTSRSTVESYLRAKREKGQLTDEEIARLDAIGFKWEKRKKKTIEEKVDLYVHYRESGKRWRCNETGERFRSLDDAFRKYGKEGDTLGVLRSRVKKGHTWHGMTITRCQTERPITSNEHSSLTNSLKRHLGKGELTEAQIEKLRRCDFPFESIKEAVGLDDRLRAIWDSEQNGAPDSLELQINKEYAWKCPVCGYRWTRKLGKERDSKGCPACLGKVVIPGWTDLATCNPDIAEEWDYERNGNLTPSDIVSGSAKRVWWKCQKCGGEWQAPPVKRKIGKGSCPYCAGRKLKKGVNDLASQYPEVALDYLPELNGGIPADEVIVKYGTKVIWKCHVCGHEWKNDVYNRTRAPKPSGCVKCQRRTASGRFRQMAIEKTGALADTNPNLAAAWDYEKNGNLTPSDIAANSSGTYWFLCRSCGASYKSYPGAKEPLCMGGMRKARGRKNGKKVVCVETGTVYETVRDAGMQVGKHPSSISHALSDGGTCAGYHWQYLDE